MQSKLILGINDLDYVRMHYFWLKKEGNVKQYIRKNTFLINKRIEKFLKFYGISI